MREAAKVNRIHDRQRELKRKELDVICDDLISRPPNQLSEHTSELAAKLLGLLAISRDGDDKIGLLRLLMLAVCPATDALVVFKAPPPRVCFGALER